MTSRREFLNLDGGAIALPMPVEPGPSIWSRVRSLIPRRAARPAAGPVLVMPAPVELVTVDQDASEIASVLSPSQVRSFTNCQTQWFYKYVLHYAEKRSSALGIGSAFHEAIDQNYREKIVTRHDLPVEVVDGLFRAAWAYQLEEQGVELAGDEDADDLENMGAAMVGAYMENVAPLIQPAAVELPVSGEIGGVKVQGKIDVLADDGTIIDAKTAAKKPSTVQPDYRFQVATYVELYPGAKGARVDTVTKTKTIQVIQQSVEIGDADRLQTAKMYPLVQEAMRSGLYVPNRGSNLCSHKHCAFAAQCEKDYGGCVDAK